MDQSYVEKHTIFETVVGSRAYGIHNADSDYDIAGVMIPGIEYFAGTKRVEQFQGYETDKTIYEIRKMIYLISDNNPNCLDLLFTPERCILKITPYWEKVIENSHLFISKKCKFTFSGYAISQLKRIKTHRGYLLGNIPDKKPERSEFGLQETSIFETAQLKSLINIESLFEYVDEENKDLFIRELDTVYAENVIPVFRKYFKEDRREVCLAYIQNTLHSQLNTFTLLGRCGYIKDEYLEEAEKELKYQNKMREWKQYEDWKKARNKKRADLEKKYGYDTKHAAHLIRLLRMGAEILSTGKVNVDRTSIDAEELKAIRNGAWSYEKVEEYANSMDQALNKLYESSTLQKIPQINKIEELCIEIVKSYLFS